MQMSRCQKGTESITPLATYLWLTRDMSRVQVRCIQTHQIRGGPSLRTYWWQIHHPDGTSPCPCSFQRADEVLVLRVHGRHDPLVHEVPLARFDAHGVRLEKQGAFASDHLAGNDVVECNNPSARRSNIDDLVACWRR